MGLEIVLLAMLMVGSVFGLIFPVVFWAVRTSMRNDRFCQALRDKRVCVLKQGETDASQRAAAQLEHRGYRMTLIACERGGHSLWHLTVHATSRYRFSLHKGAWRPPPAMSFEDEDAPESCVALSRLNDFLFCGSGKEGLFFEVARDAKLDEEHALSWLDRGAEFADKLTCRRVGDAHRLLESAQDVKRPGLPIGLPGLAPG